MKEQWFIRFLQELNVGSGGTGSVCRCLKWRDDSGWWLVIVALPCYGNSKVRLAHCASWCHVSLLGAVSFVPDRGLIPPFLLPPQAGNIKGGGMFMMDGRLFFPFFFKKEASQGVGWEGSESGRLWCDETDRNILLSRVEMSGRGSRGEADGTITLPSGGGIHRGAEKWRDSGADLALWAPVPCQLGSILYPRNMLI